MAQTRKPTKAQRRTEALAAAAKLRAQQKAKEKRTRVLAIGSIIAGLAVLTMVIMLIVREGGRSPLEKVDTKPAVAQDDGAIFIGQGGKIGAAPNPSAPTVSVYADYLCGYCKLFDETYLKDMVAQAGEGKLNVKYYPVSIFSQSPDSFSARAANAAYVVAQESPDSFVSFTQALFGLQAQVQANQQNPPSNSTLANAALGVGVPAPVAQLIEGQASYGKFVIAATQHANNEVKAKYFEASPQGLATPFILINDIPLDTAYYNWTQPGRFTQALQDARDGTYKYSWTKIPNVPAGTPAPTETSQPSGSPQPSGTPEPSATPSAG